MRSSFSKRLKELRLERGLTQAQLSQNLDNKIAQPAIALWELNKRVPNLDMVIILADYFCVSIDYLAGRTDS